MIRLIPRLLPALLFEMSSDRCLRYASSVSSSRGQVALAQQILEIYPTLDKLIALIEQNPMGLRDPEGAAIEEGMRWVEDLRPSRFELSPNLMQWRTWITRHMPTSREVWREREKGVLPEPGSPFCRRLKDWIYHLDEWDGRPAVRPIED